jgi:predicted NBD/HSP70 family sugar kinase
MSVAELRGNNLDAVRRGNLSLVLGRVHTLGAVSRAQLTRETGLNRSTIAALVAELVQLGLVVETEPDQTNQVGRPSPVIVPNDRVVAITVHPELDAVTIGLVALGGRVLRSVRYPTVRIPTAKEAVNVATAVIAGMRGELDGTHLVAGIGLAVPGPVRGDGVVTLAPHLDWHDEPVGRMLQDATGYPVLAANDASLGAIAESVRGAGRGVAELVYLNGGASGIGGGIITRGELLTGRSGYAGEIGHTLVHSDGILCHCGATGCLETEVTRAELLAVLGLDDEGSERLEQVLVERSAEPAVAAVVERQLGYLGRALANVVNVFNPELIVLGGFLGPLYAADPGRLEDVVRSIAMTGLRDDVRFARSELGPDLLAVGAAELSFGPLIADPASVRGA